MEVHLGSTGLATFSGVFPVLVTVNVYSSSQPAALPRTGLSFATLVMSMWGA